MSNYLTPGVYVEEMRALSLSLSTSETAVPVFSATNDDFKGLEGSADLNHFEIQSWLDVTNRVKGFKQIAKVALDAASKEAAKPGSTAIAAAKAGGEIYHAAVSKLQADNASLADAKRAADAAATKVAEVGVALLAESAEPEGVASISTDETSIEIDKIIAPAAKASETEALLQRFIDAYNAVATIDPSTSLGTTLARSLNAYFTNGGGRAYVCRIDSLPTVVPLLSDVTLLVEAGTALPETTINGICKSGTGVFGVLDAKKATFSGANQAELLPNATGAHVAIYHPWLKDGHDEIPPSAVMAGIYAKVDAERGVWQAPANISVQGAQVESYMTDAHQGTLNDLDAPINVIRKVRDGAATVWGARTAAKDSPFRYIQVRRLFNALERDIRRAMKRAVFEPNTSATWETVRAAIDNYLHDIWRQGGLVGEKPEDAYRVSIGKDITMTLDDIENGKMIAEVAVAPIRPAEFVVLRFSEKR